MSLFIGTRLIAKVNKGVENVDFDIDIKAELDFYTT